MDLKKQSHELKKRAKTLGYEIKLTHAQELVATIKGFTNRHSALIADTKPSLSPMNLTIQRDQINHNCQVCERNKRAKAILHEQQTWYLCLECSGEGKFSKGSDVTDRYKLENVCLRDMNFKGAGQGRLNKSFQFQLICQDGSLGDIYQYIPGLSYSYQTVSVLNVSENKLEINGWWDWKIIPLNLKE